MAYNEQLAERIRVLLRGQQVEEKKMFGSLGFMVDGSLKLCAGPKGLLCRLNKAARQEAIDTARAEPMIMNGRTPRNYVYIPEDAVLDDDRLDYWVTKTLHNHK